MGLQVFGTRLYGVEWKCAGRWMDVIQLSSVVVCSFGAASVERVWETTFAFVVVEGIRLLIPPSNPWERCVGSSLFSGESSGDRHKSALEVD